MENRDAKSILNAINQDKPGTKSWRELKDVSPEFKRFMEEVEKVQARLSHTTTPRFNPLTALRSVEASAAAAARAVSTHRQLRFSDAGVEDTITNRTMHAAFTQQVRGYSYNPAERRSAQPSPTQSSHISRPAYRQLSPQSPSPSTRRSGTIDARRLNLNSGPSTGAERVIRALRLSSVTLGGREQSIITSHGEPYDEHSTSPIDRSDVISLLEEEEEEEDSTQIETTIRGPLFRNQGAFDHHTESDDDRMSAAEDDIDASERLARQLAQEEEAAFLERLHAEQQAALSRLRSSGGIAGQTWIDISDGEEEEASAEVADGTDYDQLLELGERLGDVRTERWRMRSAEVASRLPRITFANMRRTLPMYKEDLCVICQFDFEEADEVKLMPNCTHCFHTDCADAWIKDHDKCATCKASIE